MTWCVDTMDQDVYDVSSMGKGGKPTLPKTTAELLATFDGIVAKSRAAIAKASDEHLMTSWTLKAGDHEIFSQPRWLALRTYVFNHAVHHRGQLTVYLRLLGVPVPAIYNDSADEKGGMFIEGQSIPH